TAKPAPLTFDQRLDVGADLQGSSFNAGTGFSFAFSPTYNLTVGLNLAPGLSPLDRFFLVPSATPAVRFDLSAGLTVPDSGYSGSLGYLNVGLTPVAANRGVQVHGNVSVGLSDPGTLAQDGMISFSELHPPTPDPKTDFNI